MTNHTHLALKADELSALSTFGHFVQRRYAYYYCKTYRWSGQVFQGRYKSLPVEDDRYLLECGRYIERNPLKAGLAKEPTDYPYSSHTFYAQGLKNHLITPSPAYLGLDKSEDRRRALYSTYVCETRPQEEFASNPFLAG